MLGKAITDPKEFIFLMKSGSFSQKPYSIKEWDEIISPFKNSEFRQGIPYGSEVFGYVYDEILPMMTVAKNIDSENCKIQFLGPEQSEKDGILFHESFDKGEQGIQCTTTIRGHNEAIRHEKVMQHGMAEAYGKIEYSGSKHKRAIPKKMKINPMPSNEEIKENYFQVIEEAIFKKMNEKYGGLWLVIAIHTFKPYILSIKEDLRHAESVFDSSIKENRDRIFDIYTKVFFVGTNGDYLIEYN